MIKDEYMKYKWFFTSSGRLVVGGKSAAQNDLLLRQVRKEAKDYVVMHTSTPGSPFSVILEDVKKVTKKDLEECAIFTGCFSRAWREGKRRAEVHIFDIRQLKKDKRMKAGTWGVSGKVEIASVELRLVLTRQKKVLRAVPEKSVKSKSEILLKICPGKIDKTHMLAKLGLEMKDSHVDPNELLAALPAGGVRVCK